LLTRYTEPEPELTLLLESWARPSLVSGISMRTHRNGAPLS